MKKIGYSFIIILLINACANKQENALSKEYKNTENHFSINYPATWQMDSTTFKIVEDIANVKDAYQENVKMGVEKNPVKVSALDYAKMSNTMFQLMDSTYQKMQMDSVKINGISGYKTLFADNKNGTKIKGLLYTFVHDSMAYTLQCNAEDSSFASHEKTFENIANSFKIIQ